MLQNDSSKLKCNVYASESKRRDIKNECILYISSMLQSIQSRHQFIKLSNGFCCFFFGIPFVSIWNVVVLSRFKHYRQEIDTNLEGKSLKTKLVITFYYVHADLEIINNKIIGSRMTA